MVRFATKVFGLSGALLILLGAASIEAAPLFVTVYGRTYKLDPQVPSKENKGSKTQDLSGRYPPISPKVPVFGPRQSRSWPNWRSGPGSPATSWPTNCRRLLLPAKRKMPDWTSWRSSRRSPDRS